MTIISLLSLVITTMQGITTMQDITTKRGITNIQGITTQYTIDSLNNNKQIYQKN